MAIAYQGGHATTRSDSKKGLEKSVLKSVQVSGVLRRYLAMDSRWFLEEVFLEGVLARRHSKNTYTHTNTHTHTLSLSFQREYDPVVCTLFVLAVAIAIAACQRGLHLNVSGISKKTEAQQTGVGASRDDPQPRGGRAETRCCFLLSLHVHLEISQSRFTTTIRTPSPPNVPLCLLLPVY